MWYGSFLSTEIHFSVRSFFSDVNVTYPQLHFGFQNVLLAQVKTTASSWELGTTSSCQGQTLLKWQT